MPIALFDSLTAEVSLGILCALLVLLIGLSIGIRYSQRFVLHEDKSLDDYYLGKMLRGLFHWTDDIATDVTRYRQIVDSLKRQVRAAEQQSPDTDPAAVVRLLSRIVQANDLLQQRLDSAELTLKEQAAEITSYMSEARTDTLTELPNRRVFDDELSRRMAEFRRHGAPVSVLIVDIDWFKKFNDRFGHLAGDAVLRHVAGVLRDSMREADLVARLGGEEFAILLPGADSIHARQAADRVRAAVEDSACCYEGNQLRVTVSCGVAQAGTSEDSKGVVNRADQALYASKAAGRNAAHWHDGTGVVPVAAQNTSNAAPPTNAITPAERERKGEDFTEVCDELRKKLMAIVSQQA